MLLLAVRGLRTRQLLLLGGIVDMLARERKMVGFVGNQKEVGMV